LEGEVVELLDCEEGLAQMVELDGNGTLGEDAVFLHFDWNLLRFEDLVQVSLELLAGAAPGNASNGDGGLAETLLELDVSEVAVVESKESGLLVEDLFFIVLACEFDQHG
jgi:hypothetical protein